MKAKEIKALNDRELEKFILDIRNKIYNLQIDYRTKKVTNIKDLAINKKILARTLTIKHERLLSKEIEK